MLDDRTLLAAHLPLSASMLDLTGATVTVSVSRPSTDSDHDHPADLRDWATAAGSVALDGQVFFLDLDGAAGVRYDGPIVVGGIDVPAFRVPGGLAGQEGAVVAGLLAGLTETFAGTGVVFTTKAPAGGDYSTVYLGGSGAELGPPGKYLGLAEQVDAGNRDWRDEAFVFTAMIGPGELGAEAYGRLLASYVVHEAAHLLGYEHAHGEREDPDDPLAEVAWSGYTHTEIARDVLSDVAADGKVTVRVGTAADGTPVEKEYEVHPRIVEALRRYPDYFTGGSIGPDAFPDLGLGQGVVHPDSTGVWLAHLLDRAWDAQRDDSPYAPQERLQILAWAYGFASHAAGDVWAHTLVNEFSDGPFPDVASFLTQELALANALRHLLLEGALINDATPGVDSGEVRERLPDGDVSGTRTPARAFAAPHEFIYDTFVFSPPDLPGHLEEYLFRVPEADTAAVLVELGGGGFSQTLRGLFRDKGLVPAAAPVVTVIKAGAVWQVKSDYAYFTLRRLDAADGAVVLDVYEHVKSRGVILDQFLRLREQLVRLRADLPDPPAPIGEPFAPAVDRILEEGQRLLRGDDALDTGRLLADLGAVGEAFLGAAADLFGDLAAWRPPADEALLEVAAKLGGNAAGYLDYWVGNIDAGLRRWSEGGLAFARTFFDPQSRRDLENRGGRSKGPDAAAPGFDDRRGEEEDDVSLLDVLLDEFEDPNGDGRAGDSFVNRVLLPMFGLPRKIGELKAGFQDFLEVLNNRILRPAEELFGDLNPLDAIIENIKKNIREFVRAQVLERFGVDIDVVEYLLENPSVFVDLKSVTIGGTTFSVFGAGDRERIDRYMGFTGDGYREGLAAPRPESVTLPNGTVLGFEFHPGTTGALKPNTEFDKTRFASYANSVTLSKLALLQEGLADGDPADGPAPKTLSRVFTDLTGRPYDFGRMTLNGRHGGNILTATMPDVLDRLGAPASVLETYRQPVSSDLWLTSLDTDHVFREDSETARTALYRASDRRTGNVARWTFTGLADGEYEVLVDWLVTQPLTEKGRRSPAHKALYRINAGSGPMPREVDQRRLAGDANPPTPGTTDPTENWERLGTFTVTGGTLTVELSDLFDDGQFVVAGRARLVRLGTVSGEPPVVIGTIARGDAGYSETSGRVPGSGAVPVFVWTPQADPGPFLDTGILPQGLRDLLAASRLRQADAYFAAADFTDRSLLGLVVIPELADIPLVGRLRDRADPVSQFLWDLLSPADQAALDNPLTPADDLKAALVRGLNAALTGDQVYDPARFDGVVLRRETADLLAEAPTGGQRLLRLNRMLLEDAYPAEVARSLRDDFVVTPLAAGSAWLVTQVDKVDPQEGDKVRYTEALTLVRVGAGGFGAYRDWAPIRYRTGTGNFPLWEGKELRAKAFRVLFRDWQDGDKQFPDLGDKSTDDAFTANPALAFGTFAPFQPYAPVLVAPGSPSLIVSGGQTLNFTGDQVFGHIAGDGDAAPDSLTLVVAGNVTLTGFVGGGGLTNITIVSQTGTVTLVDGATLSSRQVAAGADHWTAPSVATSGTITLIATAIRVGAEANVLAHADGPHAAGNVVLEATESVDRVWSFLTLDDFRWRSATASIDVGTGARVTGNDVRLETAATTKKSAELDRDFALATTAVALGDLDADGAADLLVATRGQGVLRYEYTAGTFGTPTTVDDAKFVATSLALGDVDGDGDEDVVVGVAGGPNRLYRNDAGVLVAAGTVDGVSRDTTAVALRNLDADPEAELVVGTAAGVLVYQFAGGAFAAPVAVEAAALRATSLALGDVEADGDLDLVATFAAAPARLFRNDGAGGFGPGADIGGAADSPAAALGDVDVDGDADLVASVGGAVLLYRSTGGGFADSVTIDPGPYQTTALTLGDLDADGDLDLVATYSGRAGRLYRNDGGTLVAGQNVAGEVPFATAAAVGQVDGQPGLDLVVGSDRQPNLLYRWQLIYGVGGYLAGEDVGVDTQLVAATPPEGPVEVSTGKAVAVVAESFSRVALGEGVLIRAANDLTLKATATASSAVTTVRGAWGVTYGDASPTATVTVGSGAALEAGNNVALDAKADTDLRVTTFVPSAGETYSISVSLATAHSTSRADVHAGAAVRAANVAVRAENTNAYRNTAAAIGFGTSEDEESGYGLTAAIGFYQSSATARVAGEVTTPGDLTVSARSVNTADITRSFAALNEGVEANERLGSEEPAEPADPTHSRALSGLSDKFLRRLTDLIDGLPLAQQIGDRPDQEMIFSSSETKKGYAVGLAFATADNAASATVGDEARVSAGRDVTVKALAEDPFQISATGSVGTLGAPSDRSFGGALAYSVVANQAAAAVGFNATVDAARTLAVEAEARMPSPVGLVDLTLAFANLGDVTETNAIGEVHAFGAAQGGDTQADLDRETAKQLEKRLDDEKIGTSFIHAGGAVGEGGTAIGGGANFLNQYNAATAVIAKGARVNQGAADRPADQDVTVTAKAVLDSVNSAGNLSVLNYLQSEEETGVGGFYSQLEVQNFATAYVSDLAAVTAGRDVGVTADADVRVVTVVVAGSQAESTAVDGAFVYAEVDNTTWAFIEDRAAACADRDLAVTGESDVDVVTVTPAVAFAGSLGVGVSGSFTDVRESTRAFVGNSQGEVPNPDELGGVRGVVDAGRDLTVRARSTPEQWSVAAAAGVASAEESDGGSGPQNSGTLTGVGGIKKPIPGQEGPSQQQQSASVGGDFGLGLAGSVAFNWLDQDTAAYIRDGVTAVAAGGVVIAATSTPDFVSVAGGFAYGSDVGIGGGYAHNELNQKTQAFTANASVTSPSVVITATADTDVVTLAGGAAVSDEGFLGAAGSAANTITDAVTTAAVGGGAVVSAAGGVSVLAGGDTRVASVAGTVSVAESFAVGGSVGLIDVDSETRALVGNATVNAGGDVLVRATDETEVVTLAVSVAASTDLLSLGGSGLKTEVENDAVASVVGAGTVVTAEAGTVSVVAVNETDVLGMAGGIAAADTAAVGAAVALTETDNAASATIDGATVRAAAVVVLAQADGDARSLAVGGAAADTAAVAGSYADNDLSNAATAAVTGGATVTAAGAVTVTATTGTDLWALAGAIAGADTVAVGLALGNNKVIDTAVARVAGAGTTVSAGSVGLTARTDADLLAITGAGAGAQTAAAAGSLSINRVANAVEAEVADGANVTSAGVVTLSASDDPDLEAKSGAGSGASTFVLAAAGADNFIGGTVAARVRDATVDAGSVTVSATSIADLEVVTAGGSGAGTAALAGSASDNDISTAVDARLGPGAVVHATGDVRVAVDGKAEIEAIAGGGSGSGGLAGGAGVATNTIRTTVRGTVEGATVESTAGGVAVAASSDPTIRTISIGGAGATGFAAGGAVSLNDIESTVEAEVTGSDLRAAGDVAVTTRAKTTPNKAIPGEKDDEGEAGIESLAGGVAGAAGAAIGVGVATNDIRNTARAAVTGSTLVAGGAVAVGAAATGTIKVLTVGGAGAVGAAAGVSVSVNDIENTLEAAVAESNVQAAGNVTVTAAEGGSIRSLSGGIAGAFGAALGVGTAENRITSQVRAAVTGADLESTGGTVGLHADSDAQIKALTVAGAGAFGAALTGSVSINTIQGDVEAEVTGSDLRAAGDVAVTAARGGSIRSLAGAVAGAFGAALSGALSTNQIETTVGAKVDGSVVASSGGDVEVSAKSTAEIGNLTLGVAGAFGAAATGSVSINTIQGTVKAAVQNGAGVTAAGSAAVAATDEGRIESGAGGAAGAFGAAFGVASSEGDITSTVEAAVDRSTVAARTVSVTATSEADIRGLTAGIAGAVGFAGVFSKSEHNIDSEVKARVTGDTAVVTAAEAVTVQATDGASIRAISGGGAGALVAAVGAASSRNTIKSAVAATVDGATVAAGAVSVQATTLPEILAVSASGSGAFGAALVGSEAANSIKRNVEARVVGKATVTATNGDLTVQAAAAPVGAQDFIEDFIPKYSILSISGSGAGAAGLAAGIAVSRNAVDGAVTAHITDAVATATAGQVVVAAGSDTAIYAVTVGGFGAVGIAAGVSESDNDIGTTVDAHVAARARVAGRAGVRVEATETSTIRSISGQLAGAGAVAVGAALTEHTVDGGVTAYVGGAGTAVTSAAGDVMVGASLGADLKSVSIGGAGAIVGVAAAEDRTRVRPTVDAHVGGGARVEAGQDVAVRAAAKFAVDVSAGALVGGGIAFGAGAADVKLDGTIKAYVADARVAARWNVAVEAASTVKSLEVLAAAGSFGVVAVEAAKAVAASDNTTEAYLGAGAVVQRAAAVRVVAETKSDVQAEADGAAGGVVAVGAARADARETGTTLAYVADGTRVGKASRVAPGVDNLTVSAGTATTVEAKERMAGGGVVSVVEPDSRADARVTPTVRALVEGADVFLTGDLAVSAQARSDAEAEAFGVNGGGFAVGGSVATADASPVLEAAVRGGATVGAGGAVTVEALHNIGGGRARADASAPAGALVALNGAGAKATAAANLDAHLSDATVVAGGVVTVRADAHNTALADADADTFGLVGVGDVDAEALAGVRDGRDGTRSQVAARVEGSTVTAGGLVVGAESTDTANAGAGAAGGGLVSANAAESTATIRPEVRASVADNVTADVSGDVTVTAKATLAAGGGSEGSAGGLVAVGNSAGNMLIAPDVQSYLARGVAVMAGGNVAVGASAGGAAEIGGSASGGGLVGVTGVSTFLVLKPTVSAYMEDDVTVDADGSVRVTAESSPRASAGAEGRTAGLAAVGTSASTVLVEPVVQSYLRRGVAVVAGADVAVGAASADIAQVSGSASGGGLVASLGADSKATVAPTVEARVGDGTGEAVTVDAGRDVYVTATATPEADVGTRGTTGGFVAVGDSASNITLEPVVRSAVGRGVRVRAGRDVFVVAESGVVDTPADETFSGDPVSAGGAVDVDADTLRVPGHGLRDGDRVVYDALPPADGSEPTPIGGLEDSRDYQVLFVDADTVRFGSAFDAGAEVDADGDLIRFATPHGFEDGDVVRYETAPDAGPPVTGPGTEGQRFVVVVVDEVTIQLRPFGSPSEDLTFDPSFRSRVDAADTINSPGHGFRDGDAVTYQAPGPAAFSSAAVDVGVTPSGDLVQDPEGEDGASDDDITDFPGNNNIYLPGDDRDVDGRPDGHTYTAGEAVIYRASGAKQVIRFAGGHGLQTGDAVVYWTVGAAGAISDNVRNGQTYYVIAVDDDELKLAATPLAAQRGGALDLDTGGAGPAHLLVAGDRELAFGPGDVGVATVGGLEDGQTYYVITGTSNPTLSPFEIQLARTAAEAVGDPATSVPVTAIVLVPRKATGDDRRVFHTLTRAGGEPPLGGLVDGVTYFVRDATANAFRLAAAPGGAAVDLDPTGARGPHTLAPAAVDLAASSGTHRLIVDLTSAPGGEHQLLGAEGLPLRLLSRPSGDGISSASASGSTGGFVGNRGSRGVVSARSVVTAAIEAQRDSREPTVVEAGRNVEVRTNSRANLSAGSRSSTTGFLSDGDSSSGTTIDNTSTVTVGDGVSVAAGNNIVLSANARNTAGAFSEARGRSLIDFDDSGPSVTVLYRTEVGIGRGAVIVAGNLLTAEAVTSTTATATARAKSSGFVFADADASSRVRIGQRPGEAPGDPNGASTSTTVGKDAALTAREVRLTAGVEELKAAADSRASARASTLIGLTNADAFASVRAYDAVGVGIAEGAAVTGTEGVTVEARTDHVDTFARARARARALGGDTDVTALNDAPLTARVTAAEGAKVTAGPPETGGDALVVLARIEGDRDFRQAVRERKARIDIGRVRPPLGAFTPTRVITWKAD